MTQNFNFCMWRRWMNYIISLQRRQIPERDKDRQKTLVWSPWKIFMLFMFLLKQLNDLVKHWDKIWMCWTKLKKKEKEIFKLRLNYKELRNKPTIIASPYTVVIRDEDKRRSSNQDLQPLSSLRFFQGPLAFEGMHPKARDRV